MEGVRCGACDVTVRRRLAAVAGVRSANVDLERGEAEVRYDADRASPSALTEAVERAVVLRPARRLLAALAVRIARNEH
ncbi:MAG: heavy-metal-associated domain-containing protein, partial [Chloroflexi bacterium]|nr:heavy-metal-associated domain-containing protein [Chloroflexota bacterium]